MKKTYRKVVAMLMAVVLVASSFAFGGLSSFGAVTTYTAGPNIQGSFDSATGTFTLTGTGATYDFRNTTSKVLGTKQAPWASVKANIKKVVVGEGITTIGDYCFYGCSALTSVSLPSTLTAINGSGTRDGQTTSFGAFRECTALESITLPSNLQTIGDVVFRGCSALKSIVIPNTVTSIGIAAFTGCTSLSSITIPDSVTSMGIQCFYGCTGLRTVTFGSGLSKVPVECFYNDTNIKTINWNDAVTEVGEWSFFNTGLVEVELPENISKISARGFADCYYLRKATIHNIKCEIANLSFNNTGLTQPQEFTVVGHTGSTAQTFAENNNYTFISLDNCDHTNVKTTTVIQATCTEKGKTETVCTDCDQLVSWAEVDALGHDYVEQSRSDDTEVDGHIRSYTKCSRCGDEKVNVTHAETEDSTTLRRRYVWVEGFYTETKRGNCQTGVISTYSCNIDGCRAVQVSDAIASGHEISSWTTTKQPTCTENGERVGHCSKCDNDVTESIKALGHDYEDVVYTDLVDKTDVDGHVYRYYPCNRCGEVKIEAEHREWMELRYTPNVMVTPTCTTGGLERDTCDICGETRDVELPNNGGHEWYESSHVDPTCTVREQTNYACTKCRLTRTEYGEALGHDLVKTQGGSTLPTCTENGSNYYECSRCSYSKTDVVDALGHDINPNEYVVTKEPTCEKEGSATSVCRRCKESYDMVVPALGHDYQDVETPIDAEPGHVLVTPSCTRCNAYKTGTKKHDKWLDGYFTTSRLLDVNCTSGATYQDTCTLCGETRNYTLGDGIGHELRFVRYINTTNTLTYICKHCARVITATPAEVFEMWDEEFYNTVPEGRLLETPSTYLDVNGDEFINAKDFAFLRNMSKRVVETPSNPDEGDGETDENGDSTGGSIGDIIGGIINDRRDNNGN